MTKGDLYHLYCSDCARPRHRKYVGVGPCEPAMKMEALMQEGCLHQIEWYDCKEKIDLYFDRFVNLCLAVTWLIILLLSWRS